MANDYILDQYYCWMLDMMDFNLPNHRNYDLLMQKLHSIDFYWDAEGVPMDENRDIDAYEMRKDFIDECGYDSDVSIWDDPRSVLEVLVAFSRKIEIMITGEPGNDYLGRWFWVMLDNLGLLEYDNFHYDDIAVDKIVHRWLSRRVTKSGKNGIFPLKKMSQDQRGVEMWYQMHAYLNENWSF